MGSEDHGHKKVEYEAEEAKEKQKVADFKIDFGKYSGMTKDAIEQDLRDNPADMEKAVAKLIVATGNVIESEHDDDDDEDDD